MERSPALSNEQTYKFDCLLQVAAMCLESHCTYETILLSIFYAYSIETHESTVC